MVIGYKQILFVSPSIVVRTVCYSIWYCIDSFFLNMFCSFIALLCTEHFETFIERSIEGFIDLYSWLNTLQPPPPPRFWLRHRAHFRCGVRPPRPLAPNWSPSSYLTHGEHVKLKQRSLSLIHTSLGPDSGSPVKETISNVHNMWAVQFAQRLLQILCRHEVTAVILLASTTN